MAAVGTGVAIGGRNVRVLQVRRTKEGSWQVQRGLIVPFSQQDPPESQRIAEARAAVTTAQAKGPALIGASGRDLIMRYTHVPPVPDWRLEMLMNFEIQEVAEQSGGDVSAAYARLEVDDATSGDNVVLVALAKNTYLKPRLEAIRSAGLDVLGACPKAVAAYWCYRENGKVRPDETIVIVNIGHENTDVAIVRKGTLLFARNVAGGGKLLTEAIQQNVRVDFATAEKLKITKGNLTPRGQAKYRDSMEEKVANAMMAVGGHFVSAVNSSVMFAKAQTKVPEAQVSRVVLTGGGSKLKGIPEYLESNLNLPVEVFDPMDAVDLSALPEEAQTALKQDQGGMAVALGLAQMAADEDAFRVSVLPEADRKRRRFREQTVFAIAAAAVLVVALVVAFVMRGSSDRASRAEREILDKRKALFDQNKRDFEKARDQVALVTNRKDTLRTLVALGPAFQIANDLVHAVLNQPEPQGYPEVFLRKITARMEDVPVPGAGGGFVVHHWPTIQYEGLITEIGGRPAATIESSFVIDVKQRALAKGFTFEKGGMATSDPSGGTTFKFRLRQEKTPEQLEREAREAAKEPPQ